MKASAVTDTLFQQLSFRGERQKVISSNIANINTPGYKTKELVFEHELEKVNSKDDLKLRVTHESHIKSDLMDVPKTNPQLVKVEGLEEQNDGNNVSLDKQMGEMSKNSIIFSALNASIKKDSRLFKSVIESSAKN
jgi:flagellar basal-body rod protein FlgB